MREGVTVRRLTHEGRSDGCPRGSAPSAGTPPRRNRGARALRLGLGIVLLAALALPGCAGISGTTYDPVEACRAVGGIYRPNGQCRAGLD